jgi:hypothetical protein
MEKAKERLNARRKCFPAGMLLAVTMIQLAAHRVLAARRGLPAVREAVIPLSLAQAAPEFKREHRILWQSARGSSIPLPSFSQPSPCLTSQEDCDARI